MNNRALSLFKYMLKITFFSWYDSNACTFIVSSWKACCSAAIYSLIIIFFHNYLFIIIFLLSKFWYIVCCQKLVYLTNHYWEVKTNTKHPFIAWRYCLSCCRNVMFYTGNLQSSLGSNLTSTVTGQTQQKHTEMTTTPKHNILPTKTTTLHHSMLVFFWWAESNQSRGTSVCRSWLPANCVCRGGVEVFMLSICMSIRLPTYILVCAGAF